MIFEIEELAPRDLAAVRSLEMRPGGDFVLLRARDETSGLTLLQTPERETALADYYRQWIETEVFPDRLCRSVRRTPDSYRYRPGFPAANSCVSRLKP